MEAEERVAIQEVAMVMVVLLLLTATVMKVVAVAA